MSNKKTDINKFQFQQMFNDSMGKTSPTIFSGWLIIVSSCGGFISAGLSMLLMIIFKIESRPNAESFLQVLIIQSIAFATIGATLLMGHRLSPDKKIEDDVASGDTNTN